MIVVGCFSVEHPVENLGTPSSGFLLRDQALTLIAQNAACVSG
jgi:hypothetical protein